MKKLLMVITVAGFVACNNSADSTTATDTASAMKADTAAAHMDTAAAHMDTAASHMDTTAKKDTLKK